MGKSPKPVAEEPTASSTEETASSTPDTASSTEAVPEETPDEPIVEEVPQVAGDASTQTEGAQ